ncbi:MAG: hypothetical protein P1U53_05280 [Sulfitobacter sp.]|nr:hypothetical protein [Sulfitobacter sp.]
MFRTLLPFLLLTLSAPAWAENCRATVNGSDVVVVEENFPTFEDEVNTRERLLNWPSRKWNKAWGTPPACNSGVLFDYLATTVPENDITGYCLSTTEAGYVLIPGERNYRGLCRKTACERVNATKDETVALTASIARSAKEEVTKPGGATAIAHKSGAMILSGSASALAANIGTAGSTVATALATPAVAAAVGVTVLSVGGAVYLCSGAG